MARERPGYARFSDETIAALDVVPVPAAVLDEEGTIRWQNQAATVLRGGRVGSPYVGFVEAGNRDEARLAFARVLEDGGSAELRLRELDADGEYVPVHDRLSLVMTPRGRVVVVLSMADVADPGRPDVSARWAATLTPRQLDVLRLLGAGRSTREIADTLGLSSATVRNHVAHLLAELGAHSRLQAVVAARRAGLIE